jgi:putative toxin-antitoxin system antitoxin component (TIGR02293 family)
MKSYPKIEKKPTLLVEPAASYGQSNYFDLALHSISKTYIKRIMALSGLTVAELINIIPVSIDTYKRKTTFQPEVTEKILEIEEVYRAGLDAFGEGFRAWMDTENVALGGIKPKLLLANSFGVRTLLNQIGRMQHGVLA